MLLERRYRFVNFRPFLFLAAFLAAGIGLHDSVLLLPIGTACFLVAFLLCRERPPFAVLLCFALILGSVLAANGEASGAARAFEEGEYGFVGRVVQIDRYSVTLDRVVLDGAKSDGNVRIELIECRLGEEISGIVRLSHLAPKNANVLANLRYRGTLLSYEVEKGQFSLVLWLHQGIKDLTGRLPETEGGIAYALLTGNTDLIDQGLIANVRYGGIAHVFAVSGLHIGIVYRMLVALFGLAPSMRRRGRFLVSLPFLLLFTGVGGCSVSSMRAFVICAVSAVFRSVGKKRDLLHALGFAVICILLVSPLQLYDVGFRLSVLACLGIALFGKKWRIKALPKAISESVATTLAAEVFLLPVLADTFGYLSTAAILLNFLFLPIVAPILVFLLMGLMLAAVTTWTGFLYPAYLLLHLFAWGTSLADFSGLILTGITFSYTAIPYYMGLVVSSDLFQITPSAKRLICSILFASALAGITFSPDITQTTAAYLCGKVCLS